MMEEYRLQNMSTSRAISKPYGVDEIVLALRPGLEVDIDTPKP
jgi:hypothetical protein